jgi:hypothetical protein
MNYRDRFPFNFHISTRMVSGEGALKEKVNVPVLLAAG